MNYELNNSKYVVLIGKIQSGKTNELINYCYTSINYYKIPVIFILRNIRADLLQLLNRFDEHSILNNKNILVKGIYQLENEENILKFLNEVGILVILCNTTHLTKVTNVLKKYEGKYNVCIDEVDFSIKSHELNSKIDLKMKVIKEKANNILGATATPFAVFSSEKNLIM
jgi:hypothetical protein